MLPKDPKEEPKDPQDHSPGAGLAQSTGGHSWTGLTPCKGRKHTEREEKLYQLPRMEGKQNHIAITRAIWVSCSWVSQESLRLKHPKLGL